MATATSDTSSKYKDIISKSSLICPGSPAVYQLKTKKQKFGTLTRMTVGEKDQNKKNKTILLVGETGAGKSTLINTLVNYTMGVKFEDNIWFEIVEREKRSQSESQTSDVIVYEIFGFEDKTLPYSLTIIDTPGYGDTRGIEHDLIISQRLLDLFRSDNGVQKINAVGLVIKASDNRLSDRLRYIFDSVMALFDKDLEENTVALITHSDGTPENALKTLEDTKIKCVKSEKKGPVHFLFDNCQNIERTQETEIALKNAWDSTKQGMHEFIKFLERSRPQKLKIKSVEVLNSCISLAACIHNLQDKIKLTELRQKEIEQTQEFLKKHEEEMRKNEKFTVEFEEVYKVKETIRGGRWWLLFFKGAVCCTVCEENCHYPGCTKAPSPEDCEVMKDGRCTSCTGKCHVSAHVKEDWRFVTKTKKVQRTLKEIKEKYEKNKSQNRSELSLLQNLGKEMEALKAVKTQLLEESYQHVVRLDQILNVNSLSTYVHLDFLIEKMKEKGDTEKVEKLKKMESGMNEGARTALLPKISNKSSKYEDIISNSSLMCLGSPVVYQLTPKTEMFGTLTRKAVGEKGQNKKNKTILLVGETGAGKSALINTLVNYTMGVKFEDNIWFEIVEREKRSQSESQTSDVIVYEIFGFEDETLPYSLTIIDTPGYGDTRGIEHDLIISQRLLDLFRSEDGVHEMNAVGLVLKASDNRLSDRLRYIFDSVVSLFGKDLEENIVALITHSNGITPENAIQALEAAKITCARNEENEPLHFMFDNCQNTQKKSKNTKALRRAWDITKEEIHEFTNFLEKCQSQKLMTTVEVLNSRIQIAACINNLQDRLELTELKQKQIKQTQEALKKHEQEMKENENFMIEVDEAYKEEDPITGVLWWCVSKLGWGPICCRVCKENCHYPCTVAKDSPEDCEVMKDGHCTVCTGKCPVSDHVSKNWRYVNKTRKVPKPIKELKEKYEKNKSENESKLSLLENLQKEMEDLEAEKTRLLEESYQHVVRLDEIAMNVNSVSTHVHLDFLIEKMKEKGDTEKLQKLEEMKSREDEGIRAALQYMRGKLSAAGKTVKKTLPLNWLYTQQCDHSSV